jgi:ParB family chromosome partitioning protein
MAQSKGLGKGFDALLPQNFDDSMLAKAEDRIRQVELERLSANPSQPRSHFDKDELGELAGSIKQHGVLQPIIVTPHGDDYYIIAGERRWRAAKLAGLKTIPAIVRTSQELQRLEIALVENIQRVNLSPMEQALSIAYLHDHLNVGYDEISKQLGKGRSTITNLARLMKLPEPAKQALHEGQIVEGHARAMLSFTEENDQLTLLDLIIKHGWSVRQAEQYVTAHKEGVDSPEAARQRVVSTTSPQTERLSNWLKTKVTLRRMAHGGKLEIAYNSDEDLDRIIQQLADRKKAS